jgi:anhydro-N-acetylmuramic acid kinase
VKVIGLMSGTSLDGIDAALLEVRGGEALAGAPAADPSATLLAYRSEAYPAERREALRALIENGPATLEDISRLNVRLGTWMAEAALGVCEAAGVDPADVAAIGAHGQTVWHDPPAAGRRGSTLQLGDAATLAERTGIAVVSDLRSRDMAAGGQGAPLVPWADRILFTAPDRARALQNLGGMGNVTWLPAGGARAPGAFLAFDTGPGVALLDAAAELATAGALRFDAEGALALRGVVDEPLLRRLMAHPFLAETPPRSTGRESFGRPFLLEIVGDREPGRPEAWVDLLATLTAFTARAIGDAYRRWVLPRGVDEVFLTGGGAHNPALQRAIEAELAPLPVRPGHALDFDPDAREAGAFALLAWAHLGGVPANVPEATGASGPRVLGSLTPGAERRG